MALTPAERQRRDRDCLDDGHVTMPGDGKVAAFT